MNKITHYLKNVSNDYNYTMYHSGLDLVKNQAHSNLYQFSFAERVGNVLLTPLAKSVTWIESDIQNLSAALRPGIPRTVVLCLKIALNVLLGVTLSAIPAAIGFCVKQSGEKNSVVYKQLRQHDFEIQTLHSDFKKTKVRWDSALSAIKTIVDSFDKKNTFNDYEIFKAKCEKYRKQTLRELVGMHGPYDDRTLTYKSLFCTRDKNLEESGYEMALLHSLPSKPEYQRELQFRDRFKTEITEEEFLKAQELKDAESETTRKQFTLVKFKKALEEYCGQLFEEETADITPLQTIVGKNDPDLTTILYHVNKIYSEFSASGIKLDDIQQEMRSKIITFNTIRSTQNTL